MKLNYLKRKLDAMKKNNFIISCFVCCIMLFAVQGMFAQACPEFNAQTYGPICNGYDICIGYIDTDQDGIGDAGEDPTGIMMTVADGLATSVAQAPINDGVFFFDADGDGVSDAVGYCYTVLFDNPTCDPEPYTPLVTLTCADGSEAMLQGGIPLTNYDILATAFGIPGGTAIYPALVGIITPPVCPMMPDGSDAVAGNVEVFIADAAGNPTATSCLVVPGPVPGCESDNTADPAANAIPVQLNPTNDPLFTALAGPDSFSCGLDAVADLSIACPACNVVAACPEFNAQTYGPICNGYDICIGYIDTDQDGIGDAGEDPTGIMMTVADGLATSVAQAPINDGVFFFDADGDGVSDAVGYCYTVLFDNPTCDPEPYTPLVTLTCADGSEAMLQGGIPLTNYDILATAFGIPGGTAIYPALVGIITPPVCPMMPDGSDAVAGNVELFVADAAGDPTATSCLVVPGPVPACDSDNTADPAANAVLVQFNPTNDPLFTALAGPDSFSCGFNAPADLSIACAACGVACETYDAVSVAAGCNVFDICIGYTDASGFDPTGTTMTVDFGTATGGTFVNDGIFAFDNDGDGVAESAGYCVTYTFDVQGCDPIPYSGLVTLMCPDGTEGVLDAGTGAIALTDADVVGGVFGVAGGGAFYPVLTAGTVTPAVCPTLVDNSDGVAASIEVTSPDATVCTTIAGEAPLCDTAGGNAAEPVQLNPITDPLLTALFGADPTFPYTCTIDETADLSYTCPACSMPPTCAVAGDLAAAPTPPVVVESTCQADGTTVAGGTIDPITCPAGSTAEYSVDGGTTWVTTVPAYMQTTAMTVTVRCLCDEDGTTASPNAEVTTVPGMCVPPACAVAGDLATAPTPPVVTESTCQADGTTVDGGTIAAITCPTGSTAEYSVDGGTTWMAAPPAYNQTGPAQTITVRCLCDEDGMTSSPAAMVTTVPGSCPPPPTCTITASTDNLMCDAGITPEDPSDDEITGYDLTVTATNLTGAGWTAVDGNGATVATGTVGMSTTTITLPAGTAADGSTITITITDDGDGTCMGMTSITLSPCPTIANIPTVGEWGLIILTLLMSITAIVGIRARREEEATA